MAHTMSLILTIFLFTPIIAPFLGVAILHVASWKMVFLTPPLFAVLIFLWSLRLEESLPRDKRIALSWNTVGQSIKKIITNRTFLRYMVITTLLFSALSSYVSSSEHIIGEIYGKPALFTWIFAGIGAVMSLCALTNSRLSMKYGTKRTIKWLLLGYTIVATALLIITLALGDPPPMYLFFIGIALLMAFNIAVEPNSSALAMEPMGGMAGMASAVYGTVFFFIGSTLGAVFSNLMMHSILPIAVAFFVIGIITLLLAIGDKRQ